MESELFLDDYTLKKILPHQFLQALKMFGRYGEKKKCFYILRGFSRENVNNADLLYQVLPTQMGSLLSTLIFKKT